MTGCETNSSDLLSRCQSVDLTSANTLRLPCQAERYVAPKTLSALQNVVRDAVDKQWHITLLGGGSNVLLPAKLKGIAIRPGMRQWWLEGGGESVVAYVGAGVNWHSLVMTLAARGLWGIENLALIPGDCGAAPVQNIGAYGVELKDVLEGVQIVELASGNVRWLSADACQFGYRDSIFKKALADKVVITQLALRLSKKPLPRLGYGDLAARVTASSSCLAVAQAVCAIRQEKLPDPQVLANAGSFFKNPLVSSDQLSRLLQTYPSMPHFPQVNGQSKLAAGWLIDQCGLKGTRQGAFGVHARQALVLVHFGGGDRRELLQFAEYIAHRVYDQFGVKLEPEPRLIQA
ncbi:UDP-N-acetylmuramate dehydrogenase [Halomonas sp. TD01]|uniref:UDP-N-acetylmuramate dehydrogenase n=1 Tax=Halomonas sp. TD01 TaxID=999141 RepID=UPI000214DEAA|nr:UDP-N-acetylmuramate dehydrogenase [Halomonas sp. TD01]EGP21097.1 UDP-N-acetylenolpyruvoylglucosamine reductase [Halomonas sp. TD01]CAH1044212.1 UDP-N-acetylenolpyruvoylglucosamine reductase (EC [Halomonas sp. TD01]